MSLISVKFPLKVSYQSTEKSTERLAANPDRQTDVHACMSGTNGISRMNDILCHTLAQLHYRVQ